MAKKKAETPPAEKRPVGRPPAEVPPERTTIINLKGSPAQRDWLAKLSRKTMIPAAAITRAALAKWAVENGHPPMPDTLEEDD